MVLQLGCFEARALNSSLPPGGNFNLTNWYLGLPVDSSGGTSGASASIEAAQLTAGYTNALYFYTGPDGAMTFWAPVTGATTTGSDYPRSELREQIIPGETDINWRGYGTHILSATNKVTEVPSTKKVIIGQIHTKTGDARPLVKLQYNDGTIEALVKHYAQDSSPNTDNKLTFQNVGLNNQVAYKIQMENGLVTVTVNGLSKSTNAFLTDTNWISQEFYFKAGSYCQDNVGPTNEGARVAFYALTRSHAPSITNQPVSITNAVGNTANFSVSATGNGSLSYQWQRYGTNLPVNATSSTLSLTNLLLASAGDYTVKITDSLGSVTSVVASLTVTNVPTNTPPSFTSNPVNKPNATVGLPYGGSLAGNATDPNAGDLLTFSKVSGPAWLSVAGNGALSGTPGAGDLGTNNWIVQVTDPASASNQATLKIIVSAASTGGETVTNLIVNDSWADGLAANTGPQQAAWWSSSATSGNSVEVYANQLGLISGTSGRGLHGIFANQTLAIGETITATYTFTTPASVTNAANPSSSAFKVALMTDNNAGLNTNLFSSSSATNALYQTLPGYMTDFDAISGTGADVTIRKHINPNTTGRFLGTTAEWTELGNSADIAYSFVPATQYTGVFSITRTAADEVSIFSSMSNAGGLMASHTQLDSSGSTYQYGMIGFWANSGIFGSTTTAGAAADNGITFSNIKIVVLTPVVSVTPPTLAIGLSGGSVVLSWATNGASGFQLEATTSLSSASWTGAGSATTIGDRNYVTNSLTGSEKFYRLKKP
jgi:hypothetical protein